MDIAAVRTSLSGLGALTGTATAAKSGSTVTCTVGDTTVTVQVARDLTVASGDVLLLLRQGSAWWAIARLFATGPAAPESDVAPDPKPATVHGTLVVTPVETRSYRPSGWRTDNASVYQGSYGGWGNHTGCAFYGDKPESLSGATVTAASIKVSRVSGGAFAGVTGNLVKITQSKKPTGAPTVTGGSSIALPKVGSSAKLAIPTAYAQALVDGTVGGLGLYESGGSPYARTAGLDDWSAAWTLTIDWSRTT